MKNILISLFLCLTLVNCDSFKVGNCYRIYHSDDLYFFEDIVVDRLLEHGFVYEKMVGSDSFKGYMSYWEFEAAKVGRCFSNSLQSERMQNGLK